MNFSEWKIWYRELPWVKKWFVVLILLRPFVDPFYYLREYGEYYSPLIIIGTLTPLIIIFSLFSKKLIKKKFGTTDIYFVIWSLLILINVIIFIITIPTTNNLENSLKSITPLFLYFYLRRFIDSTKDLEGILITLLLASVFPFILLLYEFIIGPISPEQLSTTRGGGERYRGFYADSFNYAIYLIAATLVSLYFLLKNKLFNLKFFKAKNAIIFFIFIILTLIAIKHTATWAVFTMLFSLFILFQFTDLKGWAIASVILFIFLPIIGQYLYEKEVRPLVQKEISVIEGEKNIESSFNGRMTRWIKYTGIWEEMSVINKFFGVASSDKKEKSPMISGHMHNDFLRIMFLSGIIGLVFYLSFLSSILLKSKNYSIPIRYLIISSVLVIILFSISATPTFYPNLLYFIYAIFAYASLRTTDYETQKESRYPWQAAAAVYGTGNRYRNYSKFPVKRKI